MAAFWTWLGEGEDGMRVTDTSVIYESVAEVLERAEMFAQENCGQSFSDALVDMEICGSYRGTMIEVQFKMLKALSGLRTDQIAGYRKGFEDALELVLKGCKRAADRERMSAKRYARKWAALSRTAMAQDLSREFRKLLKGSVGKKGRKA